MSVSNMAEYAAGKHNIGKVEIERRLRNGIAWTLLTLVTAILLGAFKVADVIELILLLPALLAALDLIQVYYGFSAVFGLSGIYNVSDVLHRYKRVADPESLAADKRFAWEIIAKTILVALFFVIFAMAFN